MKKVATMFRHFQLILAEAVFVLSLLRERKPTLLATSINNSRRGCVTR